MERDGWDADKIVTRLPRLTGRGGGVVLDNAAAEAGEVLVGVPRRNEGTKMESERR